MTVGDVLKTWRRLRSSRAMHGIAPTAVNVRRQHAYTFAALICCFLTVACRSTAADKTHTPQSASITIYSTSPNGNIRVVYPPPESIIPAASSFIVGACGAGSSLTCNGEPVKLSPQGFFAHIVQLKPGANQFTLVENGNVDQHLDIRIVREAAIAPITADQTKIDSSSAQPREDRGLVTGDLLELSVRATPDAEVIAQIGNRSVILRPALAVARAKARSRHGKRSTIQAKATGSVNQGLDAAYGKVYQRRPGTTSDMYVGFYRVTSEDHWQNAKIKLVLRHGGRTVSTNAGGSVTTMAQPLLAQTAHDDTIVRLGPGLSRTTPLPQGVRFLIDGWQGEQMRCVLSAGHHVWIDKADLSFENDGSESGPPPRSVARTINLSADNYGSVVTIPLSQRLPYRIEQQLKPNKLILKIFGVTANTDWITPTAMGEPEDTLIDHITWKQSADEVYDVEVDLKTPTQWGFKAEYKGTDLIFHVKAPPKLAGGSKQLKGLIICVDPGHGGKETGAIGCSGVRESDINLGIAMRLKTLLEQAGATVIMTRTADTDISLADRVELARTSQADILLSIHNNSLPDGRDPWAEHGSSSYWYHPQSISLAKILKNSLVQTVGFPDFGSRYQNLFLCRPSEMLAVLVEVGFVINPPEYATLISSEGQQQSAVALRDGLVNCLLDSPQSKVQPSGMR